MHDKSKLNMEKFGETTSEKGFPEYIEGEHKASEEIIRETNELYLSHLMSEIHRIGLDPPRIENKNERCSPYTAILKVFTKEFENSPQRKWVREQAQNVDLDSLNPRTFQELLIGLFEEGGVTWERVLVLFCFCTDLSIRALQGKIASYFIQIYFWTTCYLNGRLAYWIEQQGGWAAIFPTSVNYLANSTNFSFAGFCLMGAIAACLLYKSLH